jgi:hypothetical protein
MEEATRQSTNEKEDKKLLWWTQRAADTPKTLGT